MIILSHKHPWSKLAVRRGSSGSPSNLALDPSLLWHCSHLTPIPTLTLTLGLSRVICYLTHPASIECLLYTSEQDGGKRSVLGNPARICEMSPPPPHLNAAPLAPWCSASWFLLWHCLLQLLLLFLPPKLAFPGALSPHLLSLCTHTLTHQLWPGTCSSLSPDPPIGLPSWASLSEWCVGSSQLLQIWIHSNDPVPFPKPSPFPMVPLLMEGTWLSPQAEAQAILPSFDSFTYLPFYKFLVAQHSPFCLLIFSLLCPFKLFHRWIMPEIFGTKTESGIFFFFLFSRKPWFYVNIFSPQSSHILVKNLSIQLSFIISIPVVILLLDKHCVSHHQAPIM